MASPVVTNPSKLTPTVAGDVVMPESGQRGESGSTASADPDEFIVGSDRSGHRLKASWGNSIHVLDVESHASRDHIKRLHGAGNVGLQHHGPCVGDVRLFMDGLADAVAQELQRGFDAAVAQVFDISAIEVGNCGAWLEHGLAGFTGADHHVPNAALFVGGTAEHGGAGHIGAVVLHVAEDLDADDVTLLERLVSWRAVGDATTHTGPDLTFQAVAAALKHLIADNLRDRLFRHSWPDLAQDLADNSISQLAHLLEHGNFFVRFDHACVEIEFATRHECRARQPLAEPDVILRGHVIELDRD